MLRRMSSVTINEHQEIIKKKHLEPGKYVLCKEWQPPHAGKMKNRQDLVEWIEKCVFGDLRTLLEGIKLAKKNNKKGTLGGGNFLLASGCFMALDYLAYIFNGDDNSTANVRAYAKRFLKSVDSRYYEMIELLWRSFRNGIIHNSWPQPISGNWAKREIIVVGVGTSFIDGHFQPIPGAKYQSFGISSPILYKDLFKSFKNGFKLWLLNEADEIILERGAPHILEIAKGDAAGLRQLEIIKKLNKKDA